MKMMVLQVAAGLFTMHSKRMHLKRITLEITCGAAAGVVFSLSLQGLHRMPFNALLSRDVINV